MISYELALRLKQAGFTQRNNGNATYFLNEHLMINREDAIRMWFADKAKQGWDVKVEEELVYCPTTTELIERCEFRLRCHPMRPAIGPRRISSSARQQMERVRRSAEAVARLWLAVHAKI